MITQAASLWMQQNATGPDGTVDWSKLPQALAATGAQTAAPQTLPGLAPPAAPPAPLPAGISAGMPAPQVIPQTGPISRTYVPYTGDPNTYGMTGGEHNFFQYAPPVPTGPVPVPGTNMPALPGVGDNGAIPSNLPDGGGNGGGGADTGGGMGGGGGAGIGAGGDYAYSGTNDAAPPDSNARNTGLNVDYTGKGIALGAAKGLLGGPLGALAGAALSGLSIGDKGYTNSGIGPSTQDVDAALAAAAAQNTDTSPNAPVGAVESQALAADVAADATAGLSGGFEGGDMGGDMGGGFEGGFSGGQGDSAGEGGYEGQRWGGRTGYARGGPVAGIGAGMPMQGGFINHRSPGRADSVAMNLPKGSYVMPADVVSGRGQGNSLAGAADFARMARGAPRLARGGNVPAVPVKVSGGEYAFLPHEVSAIGGGSRERGSNRLDNLVNTVRADTVKTMRGAPKPR